jgi:hypothetical protein
MQSVSILYEMCTNKYNVPGCEYQVQVEAPPGGFDALGIRSNAHPPPWPAVQRQCGKNHFICEMISYEIACTAIKNKTYPPGPPTTLTCSAGQFLREKWTRPTHHPDLRCSRCFWKGNGRKHFICEMILYKICVQIELNKNIPVTDVPHEPFAHRS